MQRSVDFLLVGGGFAAVTAAKTLRAEGSDGSILLVSAEKTLPYHRPPLSKHFLAGTHGVERILIERESFYHDNMIEVALGTRATSVDPAAHVVRTDAGDEIRYKKLLIATGGSADRLDVPGAMLPGVFVLRTVEDANAIHAAAAAGKRAAVVGGSFLGLEVAATLSEMGIETVLIELGATLMRLLNAPEVSDFLLRYSTGRGVKFALGARATAIEGQDRATAVVVQSGERFPCDFVVLCVGITPATGFLDGSGLALDGGVVVDERLQASVPDVFAAGDVANFIDPVFGRRRRRIEHWDNAAKQGRLAARNMLGRHLPYEDLSYFYAELFDLFFDVLGAVEEGEERVARGSLEHRSYALFHLKDNILRALFSIGRPADEVQSAAELIRHRTNLSTVRDRLGDESFSLQSIPAQTVLILQGGGALGAFECGVVRALEENAVYPDIVAGVSIGAFNGAIIASHPRDAKAALESFWNELVVNVPDLLDPNVTRAATALQILTFGVPRFFRPRWLGGFDWMTLDAKGYTSIYDTTPVRELITRYVDFPRLKSSPVRLLVSAVDVATAELVTFDSYVDDLTPDHILASGSLPPGFPWTTIGERHYWDGGIISNSPLDLVIDRCGAAGKRVFIVDLFAGMRPLPSNLIEVLARRDEILFAERIRNDLGTRQLIGDFRALVDEILANVGAEAANRLRSHPRYIQLMGSAAPMTITRIVREGTAGEPSSRDYDFSRPAVMANRDQGYRMTLAALQRPPIPKTQ